MTFSLRMLQFSDMSEPGDHLPKPKYRWPWFVLAAFLAAVLLAVLWMGYAVRREKQERDFNAPLPGSPAH
jgi:cytochrome oxidase assembly protein ShyY1